MKFEGTKIFGIENAFIGMRLPMCKNYEDALDKGGSWNKGEENLKLAQTLIKGDSGEKASGHGQPNSKFLRMIHVQVAITAPLYLWKEISTYKVGTTSNSTSTMHRITNYPITDECFEKDETSDKIMSLFWEDLIKHLEFLRQKFNETKDKTYWKELIRLLPESWLQTRMWDADYQTLRNIYYWRKNHKLTEWHVFCDWIKTLPYAKELLTDGE